VANPLNCKLLASIARESGTRPWDLYRSDPLGLSFDIAVFYTDAVEREKELKKLAERKAPKEYVGELDELMQTVPKNSRLWDQLEARKHRGRVAVEG